MASDSTAEGVELVLAGLITGRSIELLEKQLLKRGIPQSRAAELISRAIDVKERMKDGLRQLQVSQMRHPKSSGPSGGRYFEVPVTRETFLCSDRECSCLGHDVLTAGKNGYLFISPEVVITRSQYPSWCDMLAHLQEVKGQSGAGMMVVDVNPLFMCEEGARQRGLDLEIAAADAENWVKVGLCPLRSTPSASSRSPEKWWKFW
jgi:hypothetical protein